MKNPNSLVGADWLQQNLNNKDIRIVEIDVSDKSYSEGHIRGAVLWNIYTDLKDEQTILRDRSSIEDLIQQAGIDDDTTVVFYGYAPAFGYWLMSLLGHKNLHILNTSNATWQRLGNPMSTELPSVKKGNFKIKPIDSTLQATHAEMAGIINNNGHKILDVRSKLEYDGERFWPSGGIPEGARAGHVPSAIHIPADGVVKEDGSFMTAAELEEFFSHTDLSKDEDIVTYCTIGARASTVWFVLSQILGYSGARVYDDSWARWGMDPSTEIS